MVSRWAEVEMADRYLIALSFGASWLLLGWGTYGFVKIRRWYRSKGSRNG